MSGVYGIINLDGKPVAPEDMDRMRGLLAHRGPDGYASYLDGPVGLGRLMLHSTPESLNEPLSCHRPQYRLTITADVRLDNRQALFDRLSIEPRAREGLPDSALLLEAYKKWGRDCPGYLLGEFAFAIWDHDARTLFCARDHIGFRPLFYYCDGKTFVFASESKAIRGLPFVPTELNETTLAVKLLYAEKDPAQTFFINILRLRNAHWLTLGGPTPQVRVGRYWEPQKDSRLNYAKSSDYAEALREIVIQSVHCRLRTIRPVGLTLSGGLDSSSIACIAARHLRSRNKKLLAVSSVLPLHHQGPEQDERKYIQAVLAQEPNIEGLFVTGEDISPFDDLETAFEQLEIPPNPHQAMRVALWKVLRDNGAGLILCGEGGDFMASYDGRDALLRLVQTFKFRKLIALTVRISRREGKSVARVLNQWALKRLPAVQRLHSLIKNTRRRSEPSLVNDLFLKRFLAGGGRLKTHPSLSPLDYKSHLAKKIRDERLVVEDMNISQSHFGLQSAFPFFDVRIVDFFMATPPEQFIEDGQKRSLFRRAMEGILPPEIQRRPDKLAFWPDKFGRILAQRDELTNFLDMTPPDDPVWRRLDIDIVKEHCRLLNPASARLEETNRSFNLVSQAIITIRFLHWFDRL